MSCFSYISNHKLKSIFSPLGIPLTSYFIGQLIVCPNEMIFLVYCIFVYLVYLVYFVYPVYLVYLVCLHILRETLIWFVKFDHLQNKINSMFKPTCDVCTGFSLEEEPRNQKVKVLLSSMSWDATE